jgi:signal transduction histidine kinase
VSATRSPSADPDGAGRALARRLRSLAPSTFQGRLTVALVLLIAITLALVSLIVLNRLDDYFTRQQEADLELRQDTVTDSVGALAAGEVCEACFVVGPDGVLNPEVRVYFEDPQVQRILADTLAQADVRIRFGRLAIEGDVPQFIPAEGGDFAIPLRGGGKEGQSREQTIVGPTVSRAGSFLQGYAIEVTLSNPYTFRASALANLTGLLAAIALFALGLSVVIASGLTRRFTTPLRRLTDASRALAEGDLTRRVPPNEIGAGSAELAELAVQFNAMADRVEESVEMIRRDRDRSRDFLADVSHELRTPIAALRTFNELLKGHAGVDPVARTEFLESGGQQIERLDWLATNLLELSKLDSGLVLLDLRPDDLRAAIESAVEQAEAGARKRGVDLAVHLPDRPLRIRHDPQRIGQVVSNLVLNAIKFTPRDGTVDVTLAPAGEGARIEVADTGVGIDAAEMPHIFERFYRGSRSNEARGSGSGLGLAIVHSIVDMHGGSIVVESSIGGGSRFSVTLPADPRLVAGTPAAKQADVASADAAGRAVATEPRPDPPGSTPPHASPHDPTGNVAETSPSDGTKVNPQPAP